MAIHRLMCIAFWPVIYRRMSRSSVEVELRDGDRIVAKASRQIERPSSEAMSEYARSSVHSLILTPTLLLTLQVRRPRILRASLFHWRDSTAFNSGISSSLTSTLCR